LCLVRWFAPEKIIASRPIQVAPEDCRKQSSGAKLLTETSVVLLHPYKILIDLVGQYFERELIGSTDL